MTPRALPGGSRYRPSHRVLLIGLVTLIAVVAAFCAVRSAGAAAADTAFKLESSAVIPNGALSADQAYNRSGCGGKNISPPLRWNGAPSGTKSFALTMFDPDARGGAGWWHWAVYDIPASSSELSQGAGNPGGALPAPAVQARIDFGIAGYGGPCPPTGDKPHHYLFSVYALKTEKLPVAPDAPASVVNSAIKANQLASASLTATYGR